jgi:hypothetical protein
MKDKSAQIPGSKQGTRGEINPGDAQRGGDSRKQIRVGNTVEADRSSVIVSDDVTINGRKTSRTGAQDDEALSSLLLMLKSNTNDQEDQNASTDNETEEVLYPTMTIYFIKSKRVMELMF